MRISDMNWQQVEAYLARDNRAVVPLGSTEQHAFLSLSVDSILAERANCSVRFHNWWNAPKTLAQVHAIDPVASHASWMENFPWTRLADVAMPDAQKPMTDLARLKTLGPQAVREHLKDGNYGGLYQRDDEEMMKIWQAGVEETRALLSEDWT